MYIQFHNTCGITNNNVILADKNGLTIQSTLVNSVKFEADLISNSIDVYYNHWTKLHVSNTM